MYDKGLYHAWVPKPIQLILIFLSLIFILPAGGIYTANNTLLYAELGGLSEQFTFANNASTIGMCLAVPIILSVIKHFRFKEMALVSLVTVAILSYVIIQLDDPYLIIIISFLIGFFKYFGLLVFILPVMRLVAPSGERAPFYIVFYPISICVGQIATYVTAKIAYENNWRSVYLVMSLGLLICALLAIIFMHNKRGSKQVKMSGVDWKSALLFASMLFSLNYIFTFSKQQGWFTSEYIRYAILWFLVSLVVFIYRQAVIMKPYVAIKVFKTRNVISSIIVILLMGMYLATAVMQTSFTNLLGYDLPAVNMLNLAMLPGIIIGALICNYANKNKWSVKPVVFLAFSCFLLSVILMYFLVAPVIQIEYLLIPIFLKGVGMTLLYISISLYILNDIGPEDLMPVIAVFMSFRTFIGTSFFSAVFTWAIYKLQLQQLSNLASEIDVMDPFANLRGTGLQIYSSVSTQAALVAIKELYGYIAIIGIVILIFVSFHPFKPLHHRKIILARKKFRGESIYGYREKSLPLSNDLSGAAISAG
jgi:DHA2 family multidrug resistance protein